MPLEPQPAHYPAHALGFGFPRSKQNDRNRVDPLMHKTPATGSRVFLTFTVCAKSEKSTRPVARFVQVTVFFEQITDSVQ